MASLLERPADGAVVTTLTAGAVGVGVLSGTVGLLSGLSLWHAALLAVLVPLALSATGAAVLGLFMATALDPYPEEAESRLQRRVEDGAADDEAGASHRPFS